MAETGFTIYTLGDTATFETMLQGVALAFQDGFFHGDGPFGLGYGVFLGALILFGMALYQSVFNKRMELKTLITPLILYIILTMPKTDVVLVDVYNQEPVKRVSSVPLGLALPMNLMSSLAYSFTESMETAYSTPTSPRLLTDGFVSPLKTLYSLRYINISEENPYLSGMINNIYRQCVMYSTTFDVNEYKNSSDSYRYFTTFLTNQAQGIVQIQDRNGVMSNYSCSESAGVLQNELESYINGDGSTTGSLNYNLKRGLNSAMMMQNNVGLLQQQDTTSLINSFMQVTDLGFDEGRLFMMNTLFNQPLQTASLCSVNNAEKASTLTSLSHCAAWVQGEEQLVEDNAAGATGFLSILQNGQNILLILALLLFPVIVLLIMFMGMKSMTAISGYLMFIASIYLWMPMAAIVNFYTYSKLRSTLNSMGANDAFALADYPAFYQAVSEALSVANGISASLPIFCMMFFSGMTMAVVGMMRRLDITKNGNYDQKLNVPDGATGSPFATRSSMTTSNGLGSVTDKEGGKAFTASFSTDFTASGSAMVALQRQKQILESKTRGLTSEINKIDGLTVTGESTRIELKNINAQSKSEVVSGSGFSQEHVIGNSGTIATKGDKKVIEATESDKVTLANTALSQVGVGVGLKVGKGNTFSNMEISADGSPLTDMSTDNIKQAVAPDKDNAYSLGFIQFKVGSKNAEALTYQDLDTKNSKNDEREVIYKGSAKRDHSFSEKNYDPTGTIQDQRKINNTGEEQSNSVLVASQFTTRELNEKRTELSKQLADTQSELDQIVNKIKKSISMGFTTNMLDTDVVHRIHRHDSVRNDLDRLAEANKLKYGERWNQALINAEHQISSTGLAVTKQANTQEFDYYKIVLAGMQFDYNSSSEVFKALTGFDYSKEELDRNLRSANVNWDKLSVDTNALNKGMDALFGASFSFAGEATYLSGALKVHGDQQQRNMIMVYNAFLSAGFSAKQAAILTAEVGRENSFNSSSLYGTHYDPKKAHIVNGGMISFNQDRKKELDQLMLANGLVEKGGVGTASYVKNQASLNVMAAFMYKELTTGDRYAKSWAALNNESLTKDQIHYTVGKNYIVWRIDDAEYSVNGNKNRKAFEAKLDKELEAQAELQHEPSLLSGIRGANLSDANNLSQALSKTGLKGKILGNGFVDNSYIANTGLSIKAPSNNRDQAYGGGQSRGYTVEFAHLVNQHLGNKVKYFSGFNDEYHKNVGSKGKHVSGQAFDLVLNNNKDVGSSIKQIQQLAKQYGYSIAVIDEYKSKSKDFTGDHLHVSVTGREQLQNKVVAAINTAHGKAETQFNAAQKTETTKIPKVQKRVESNLPTGKGKNAILSQDAVVALHQSEAKKLTQQFDQDTVKKFGVTAKKDTDNSLTYNVKDISVVGEAVKVGLPPAGDNLKNTMGNLGSVVDAVANPYPDVQLQRQAAESKKKEELPPISMYNLQRSKAKAENLKENRAEQSERIGISTTDLGKNSSQITNNRLETADRLASELDKELQKQRQIANPHKNPDLEALRKLQEQQRGM
ncbi:hypothetical protein HLH17_02105 [Acinetobacter sp. ANC 5380]|uniref:TraG N-terminal Proteobacteria domain-containing protein n=1 Tax=Acinetobacter terrae TaxID=2731247 RepID=A0A7Y2RCY1_9GAMM|nr:conjugal transfer protein TraG N-terminal domain-containing protein [Acinetobacter terrae]NNH76495.1 hypothetical protein [Acinetobacter terrae]